MDLSAGPTALHNPTTMDGYGYGGSPGDTFGAFGSSKEEKKNKRVEEEQPASAGSSLGSKIPTPANGRDFLDSLFSNVNYDLLVSKTFYFFFFAAFGSLFPLIAVYFKQLGMNPAQTGVLIGFRPFVEFVSGPFWSNIADRWNKWKQILLFSLFCWVAFTLALAFVAPPADSCLVHNGTSVLVVPPWMAKNRPKRDLGGFASQYDGYSAYDDEEPFEEMAKRDRYIPPQLARTSEEGEANPTDDKSTNEKDKQSNDKLKTEKSPKENGKPVKDGKKGKDAKPKEDDRKTKESKGKAKDDKDTAKEDKTGDKAEQPPSEKGDQKSDTKVKSESTKTSSQNELTTQVSKLATTTPYNYFAEGRTVRFLPHPRIEAYGKSPLSLDHKDIANLGEIDARGLVSPPLSAVVYKSVEIQKIFLILLVLMIIGEFLSAPAIELADAATLGYLGDDMENYGRQRLFGSLGWAISMFFVGIALDHSNIFPNHPCGNEQLVDRNYTVCFAVFSVLMCCAFIAATQFRFKEGLEGDGSIQLTDLKDKVIDKVQARIIKIRKSDRHSLMSSDDETPDYGYDQYKAPSGIPSSRDTTPAGGAATADPDKKLQISLQGDGSQSGHKDMLSDATAGAETNSKPSPYVPRGRPGQSGRLPQWVPVLKMYGNIRHGSVLFILWFMGFGVGVVFAFLFWHLQDLHGTPTLFGIASVINHISEVLAYFFSKKLISRLGHVKVLYLGMLGNVARYLYISWLRNPWWVLPFEFLQGLTHAAVWAAGCSYLTQVIPAPMRPTGQGILMAVHHGLGRAFGTIIGGALVHSFGTEMTFRGYGITTIIILVAYVALNYFYISKYLPTEDSDESHQVLEETSHLAPYGVPMSISHSRSNTNMDDMGSSNQQYGAAGQGSGNGNFLNPGNAPQSGGFGGGSTSGDGGSYQGGGYSGDKNPYHHGYSYKMDDFMKSDRLDTSGKKSNTHGKKVGDTEAIKNGFMAYDQAVTMTSIPDKPIRDTLVIGNVPKPTTEICMLQPRNQYAYDQEGDWY